MQTAYQLVYLAAIYKLAGLGLATFLRIVGLVAGLIVSMTLVTVLLSWNDWLTPFFDASVLALIAGGISLSGVRQFVLVLWREPDAPEA